MRLEKRKGQHACLCTSCSIKIKDVDLSFFQSVKSDVPKARLNYYYMLLAFKN